MQESLSYCQTIIITAAFQLNLKLGKAISSLSPSMISLTKHWERLLFYINFRSVWPTSLESLIAILMGAVLKLCNTLALLPFWQWQYSWSMKRGCVSISLGPLLFLLFDFVAFFKRTLQEKNTTYWKWRQVMKRNFITKRHTDNKNTYKKCFVSLIIRKI